MSLEPEPSAPVSLDDPDGDQLVSALALAGSATALTSLVDAALGFLAALAFATIGGADGASITLLRGGAFGTVAATDETILRMDAHQYATGEGPCLDASNTRHWIQTDRLATEGRWPAFGPRAMEEGISSILSTPILGPAGGPHGALNLYSRCEASFAEHQRARAATYAAQGSETLALAALEVTDDQLEHRIAGSLAARRTIAQAQGVIMARRHVPQEVAAAILQRSARAGELTLLEYATGVTDSMGNTELIG